MSDPEGPRPGAAQPDTVWTCRCGAVWLHITSVCVMCGGTRPAAAAVEGQAPGAEWPRDDDWSGTPAAAPEPPSLTPEEIAAGWTVNAAGQRVNKPMLDQALRELAEMQEGTPGGYAAPEPLLTEEERATLRAIAAKREVAGWSEAGLLRRLLASEAQAQDGLRYAREEAARAAQVAVEVEEKLARAHAEAETLRGALAKLVNHRAHRSKGCTICDPARALSVRPPADPPKGDETG